MAEMAARDSLNRLMRSYGRLNELVDRNSVAFYRLEQYANRAARALDKLAAGKAAKPAAPVVNSVVNVSNTMNMTAPADNNKGLLEKILESVGYFNDVVSFRDNFKKFLQLLALAGGFLIGRKGKPPAAPKGGGSSSGGARTKENNTPPASDKKQSKPGGSPDSENGLPPRKTKYKKTRVWDTVRTFIPFGRKTKTNVPDKPAVALDKSTALPSNKTVEEVTKPPATQSKLKDKLGGLWGRTKSLLGFDTKQQKQSGGASSSFKKPPDFPSSGFAAGVGSGSSGALKLGPAKKLLGPLGVALDVIDIAKSDNKPKAIFKTAATVGLGALGSLLGPAGTIAGAMVGDVIGEGLGNLLFKPKAPKPSASEALHANPSVAAAQDPLSPTGFGYAPPAYAPYSNSKPMQLEPHYNVQVEGVQVVLPKEEIDEEALARKIGWEIVTRMRHAMENR